MTGDKIELLRQLKDLVICFLQELMAVFITVEVAPEKQQLAKLAMVILTIALIALLFWFVYSLVSHVLKPLIESLSKEPAYILMIVMAVLLLFFTSQVTFRAGCTGLFFFILLYYVYDWNKNQSKKQSEKHSDERRNE